MWNCSKCEAIVEDASGACHRCGAMREKSEFHPVRSQNDELAGSYAAKVELVPIETVPPPRIEPPVASTLAAWVWMLAIFAFFPLLGLVPAMVLAVLSVVVAFRDERLAWDRRIGVAGLIVALASLGIAGLWGLMLFLRLPFDWPTPGEMGGAENQSWKINAMQLGVLVMSIVLHECAHAVSAYWCGDGTAARLGRIRLNPLVHVDLFGSVILPVILLMSQAGVLFGWAKPVPIDRRQFRSPRNGLLAVTLAGVSINMMLAMGCTAGLLAVGSALRIAYPAAISEGFMIPLAPVKLQGVANAGIWVFVIMCLKYGMVINLVLFTFNILPIPPLDGYGVLESLAPAGPFSFS